MKNDHSDWKPFISVMIIIFTFFGFAFVKMENRRLGYSLLKLAYEEKKMRDRLREQMIFFAKLTGPEHIQRAAQARLNLRRPEIGQIIQMTETGVALRQ